MAFALDPFDGGPFNDLKYFQFVAQVFNRVNERIEYQSHQMHICSEEELDSFYPAESYSKDKIDQIAKGKGFWCLDW